MALMMTVDGWHYEDMEGYGASELNLFFFYFYSFMYLYLRDCCSVGFLLGVSWLCASKVLGLYFLFVFACINWTILICDVTSPLPYLEDSFRTHSAYDICN